MLLRENVGSIGGKGGSGSCCFVFVHNIYDEETQRSGLCSEGCIDFTRAHSNAFAIGVSTTHD